MASAARPKWRNRPQPCANWASIPLMVDSTVKRQREMGAIGKQEKVRKTLNSGRAAMLDAISTAAKDRHLSRAVT